MSLRGDVRLYTIKLDEDFSGTYFRAVLLARLDTQRLQYLMPVVLHAIFTSGATDLIKASIHIFHIFQGMNHATQRLIHSVPRNQVALATKVAGNRTPASV
jgi:hypothetical protein